MFCLTHNNHFIIIFSFIYTRGLGPDVIFLKDPSYPFSIPSSNQLEFLINRLPTKKLKECQNSGMNNFEPDFKAVPRNILGSANHTTTINHQLRNVST